MVVGILAIQGDFQEHAEMFRTLGVQTREVRSVKDLQNLSGLVLPGGESTVISQFLREEGLMPVIRERAGAGMPVFGTCAGAILLAKKIQGYDFFHLGLMDITVARNAYGRQAESFIGTIQLSNSKFPFESEPEGSSLRVEDKIQNSKIGNSEEQLEGVFIRAPEILSVGAEVQVLGEYENSPVLVQQGNFLASTFHPELTSDSRVHQYFAGMCSGD
jgi:5'-phosphate synthase pdxT subunit